MVREAGQGRMGHKAAKAVDRTASFGRPFKGKGGALKGAIFHPVAQKGGGWEGGRETSEWPLCQEQVADRSVGIRGVGPI